MELKKKIEALLFSSGKRMHIEEISRLCSAPPDRVKNELIRLAADYGAKDSSLLVQNDGEYWKLATKEDYMGVVKNIVKETELSKTLMETLATIAFKYPIKQSDLIKIRTNKAYDHLMELEKMGYITRQKYGRTKLIKLTERFFNYFNLKEENLKDKFKDFQSLANAIEGKEVEIEKIKDEQKKIREDAKKEEETLAKEVDLVDDKGNAVALEVVDEPKEVDDEKGESKVEEYSDKVGNLEVVDEPKEVIVGEEGNIGEAVEDVLGVEESAEKEQEDSYEKILKEAEAQESAETDNQEPTEKKEEGNQEEKQKDNVNPVEENKKEDIEKKPEIDDDSKKNVEEGAKKE